MVRGSRIQKSLAHQRFVLKYGSKMGRYGLKSVCVCVCVCFNMGEIKSCIWPGMILWKGKL